MWQTNTRKASTETRGYLRVMRGKRTEIGLHRRKRFSDAISYIDDVLSSRDKSRLIVVKERAKRTKVSTYSKKEKGRNQGGTYIISHAEYREIFMLTIKM